MSRIKNVIKVALPFVVAGLIGIAIGLLLLVIGLIAHVDGLNIAAIVICLISIALFLYAYSKGRAYMLAMCPQCEKFMGNTDKPIEYSFSCTGYEPLYDKQSGQIKNYQYHYTCTVICPHCGSTATFAQNATGKTKSEADVNLDKWLKSLLKIQGS